VRLTVTVGKEEVREQYDALIADYAKKVLIPGFRKGKVPKDVLVRKFGGALNDEALNRIIGKSIKDLFEDPEALPPEAKPLPYRDPELKETPVLDPEQDLSFSVVYDVLPKVEVPQWEGIEIEIPEVEVEKEDIDRELEALRERNALVLDRDDGAQAAKDDVVTVSYSELDEQGQALAGTERQDYVFTLGSGMVFYKFDDEILGMKKGETRDFDKSFPQDYEDPVLAGTTKKLRVTLTALKEKQLPDLDDDLAQDVNEKYKTLEDLKNDIRTRLTKNLENRLRSLKIQGLLEKFLEKTDIPVPESMMRLELESRWRSMARRFGVSPEQLLKILSSGGKGYDQVLDEWRPEVKKALQSRLIVETLIKDLALEAPDEDLEKEFETLAANSETSLEDVKKYYEQETMRDYLRENIKEHKLFDKILSEITIKRGKQQKYLDLTANNG
jgi:trigger factor